MNIANIITSATGLYTQLPRSNLTFIPLKDHQKRGYQKLIAQRKINFFGEKLINCNYIYPGRPSMDILVRNMIFTKNS